MAEPITVDQAKDYLRILDDTSHDTKLGGMITRAREWVEDYAGIVLMEREFTTNFSELGDYLTIYHRPVTEIGISYGDPEDPTGFEAFTAALSRRPVRIYPVGSWPILAAGAELTVTYTAGADDALDQRLLGAMYALIEGEFGEGYAYPDSAVEAAKRCCGHLHTPVLA